MSYLPFSPLLHSIYPFPPIMVLSGIVKSVFSALSFCTLLFYFSYYNVYAAACYYWRCCKFTKFTRSLPSFSMSFSCFSSPLFSCVPHALFVPNRAYEYYNVSVLFTPVSSNLPIKTLTADICYSIITKEVSESVYNFLRVYVCWKLSVKDLPPAHAIREDAALQTSCVHCWNYDMGRFPGWWCVAERDK